MWEALGFIVAGIGVGLVGRHFRKLFFREYAEDERASRDSVQYMNASLMRRGAAIFLTTGAMMILVGGYLALSEIWNFLRQG